MADQQPRGRGRGRGRGAATVAAPTPAPVAQVAAPPPPVAAAPKGRGRGRGRASTATAAPPAAVQQGAGDLVGQIGKMSVAGGNGGSSNSSVNGNGNGNGNGTDGQALGRGAVRPVREANSVLITKPANMSAKQGTDGQLVKLTANYFELIKKQKTWSLCKHHVDVRPEEDRTFMKKKLLRQHYDKFHGYLFDGSTLFTFMNFCPDGKPKELVSQDRDGKLFTLTLKFVGTVEPSDYQYLQIFNIVFRGCMEELRLKLIRRDYFDPQAKIIIDEHGLELWPGYTTASTQCETDIMLLAEIKYKVLRRETVYHTLQQIYRQSSGAEDFKTKFTAAVIGSVIMTTYNDKTYRIDEVDYSENPNSTFEQKKRGQTIHIRYSDYFKEKYNITVRDPKQPMLISRSNARERSRAGQAELVYLVPEFCLFTGLTDQMRANYRLMKCVNETTCVDPSSRIQRLRQFNKRLTSLPQVKEKLSSWGLELSSDLVKFDGRILPSEKIRVTGQEHDAGRDANWDRSLRTNHMLHSVNIEKWVLVFLSDRNGEARSFANNLIKAANGMRYTIAQPQPCQVGKDTASEYVHTITNAVDRHNPELVVIIVPNNRGDRYNAIKRKLILEKPTPSQVVLSKNVTDPKKAMSVATKVAIQLNCKLGGAPWGVQIPVKGLMTIGFDVCHDPSDKKRSYGAMVATLDQNCVRWTSNVVRHPAGEELSGAFATCAQMCLAKYRQINGALPTMIVIYRDGIGDGQIEQARDIELKEVKRLMLPEYEQVKQPLRLAYVIVTKRINTRIFLNENNPPPGTIVDSCITSPFRYDFFLVAQSVRQGTVTPTHYNVIEDTTGLLPNYMQRLTYKFTHLYFNWSGTVRVPAPCQYAHKLAMLTSQSVCQTHSNLDRLLYFL